VVKHSIRINDQYRLCFTWSSAGPEAVEIVDYPEQFAPESPCPTLSPITPGELPARGVSRIPWDYRYRVGEGDRTCPKTPASAQPQGAPSYHS